MYPEGGYCTAIMDSGTLCVLMTGIPQDTRPELYVRAWATTHLTTVNSEWEHMLWTSEK